MTTTHFPVSIPTLMFEALEPRLLLSDATVGTITMPFDGYLSAAVYDLDGNFIATLRDSADSVLEAAPQQAGQITLVWDGVDAVGRTVMQDGQYTWRALVSQVEAVDQGSVGDSSFSPEKSVGNFHWHNAQESPSGLAVDPTKSVTVGEWGAGGAFARAQIDAFYADTDLSATYSLNNAITASGEFQFNTILDAWSLDANSGMLIGHFSEASGSKEFMGIRIDNYDGATMMVTAFAQTPGGTSPADSDVMYLPQNINHTFSYAYDPNYESEAGHTGPEGRLTIYIDSLPALVLDLSGGMRNAGMTLDSFGIGYTSNVNNGTNPAATAKLFIDNMAYSGHSGTETFDSDPGWTGSNNTSSGNSFGRNQFTSRTGGIYTTSLHEDGGMIYQKASADDWSAWGRKADFGHYGVATDGAYLFISIYDQRDDTHAIYRYYADNGVLAPFTGTANDFIVMDVGSYELPANQNKLSVEQWRMQHPLWGMATDGMRLFVSDYRNDRLYVYDSATGLKLGEIVGGSSFNPLGVAVESSSPTSGAIWVANSGNRVSRYTYSVSGGVCSFNEDASRRITGLSDPGGVAIGGSSNHLFIAQVTGGSILEYDISSTPSLANTWGSLHQSGPFTQGELEFYWYAWSPIAIDSTGMLSVMDGYSGNRTQTFFTEGPNAGEVDMTVTGHYSPMPVDTFGYGEGGTHFLVSDEWVYEVDPEYTGGPRDGWLGDGSWRIAERYNGDDTYGTMRRTLDGQDFFFRFTRELNVIVYAIEPEGGVRMSAIVGSRWTGNDLMLDGIFGMYNWTDSDIDGQIDWDANNPNPDNGEITWTVPLGSPIWAINATWVDDNGDIWFRDGRDSSWRKVTFNGLDPQGNPLYDWNVTELAMPYTNDDWDFVANFARPGVNGTMYAVGRANFALSEPSVGLQGGSYLAVYDSDGNRQLIRPVEGWSYAAIAADETDPESKYFYAGTDYWPNQPIVHMFTNDGLLVTSAMLGEASGYGGGWIDQPWGVGAFTHPVTGVTYVYAEEVLFGKSTRYRIDNMDTIQRLTGTFLYTAENLATGQWALDGNLNDSIGGNNGTYYGGSASYQPGRIGNALSMTQANADYVNIPYANDAGAYTIMAWVKPNDVSNVNIISRTNASGPATAYSHQIRINAAGKFEHSTRTGLATIATVTGTTTAQAGQWYHVAIVADEFGQTRLLVNGQEEASMAISNVWADGDRYHIGDSAVSGTFDYFDGLIDDLRIYEIPLLAGDIQALIGATVTVEASDPTAAEQGQDTGTFVICRTTSSGALTVNYALSGLATNGSDYSTVPTWVVIPDGQTSAVITLTPIDDGAIDPSESVVLTLSASSNYLVGTPGAAAIVIADNEATGDIAWLGNNNINPTYGNNFGWSYNTNQAGGSTGEIGGVLARATVDAYYGDTNLTTTLGMGDTITASGKFDIASMSAGWYGSGAGRFFIGHFSENSTDDKREFIGMEIENYDATRVLVRVRFQTPTTTYSKDSDDWFTPVLIAINGNHTFSYTYDPSIGQYGRLTLTIDSTTIHADMSTGQRSSTAQFDAFGMGYTSNRNTLPGSTKTVTAYMDDVTYSGQASALLSVTAVASDTSASEQEVYAADGFESGTASGGSGWGGNWTFGSGASVVTTGTPQSGTEHLQLTGNNSTATRAANLAGVSSAKLTFAWKANGFHANEAAYAELWNGSSWVTVKTIYNGDDDNAYHAESIDLPAWALTSTFQSRFRSVLGLSGDADYLYIDNVMIVKV